ncbi:MAG: hypothetical protein II972_04070 [Elusimicrobiaceae bacterium]|nr:hypothetical protein [Elusimicrobiaceae bacterium]MBQ6223873.1 hypothetical protein [Campylobacter sp.]
MKINLFLLIFILYFSPLSLFAGQDLSALLGGSVQSNKWIINRDKEQEEFIGNVRYQNDIYNLRSDYALSQRKENTYLLKGNILASQTLVDTFTQIKAEEFFYNNKTLKGYALGKKNRQIEILYKTPNNTFNLYGNRVDFNKDTNFIKITGNSELDDLNNTLYADTITFNTQSGLFEAYEKRPVLWGFGVDGDYALQADKITADTQKNIFKAQGNIQGWFTLASDFKKIKEASKK